MTIIIIIIILLIYVLIKIPKYKKKEKFRNKPKIFSLSRTLKKIPLLVPHVILN